MTRTIRLAIVLGLAVVTAGCGYIVVPGDPTPDASGSSARPDAGWSAVATKVEQANGGLHVELAIRNDTGDWSEMHAVEGRPAHLDADGKTTDCATVTVGTGGHRLAPGFRMRAYTTGAKLKPTVEPLVVECAGATATKGTLSIDYSYVTGVFNYFVASTTMNKSLKVDLGATAGDLTYPVGTQIANVVEKADAKIAAINDCTLTLKTIARTATGIEFTWEARNPADAYRTTVRVTSPVIGADGVIYGVFESPALADAPETPAKGTIEWKTSVTVPTDAKGLYILASVESLGQKMFLNHAIDITDK